MKKHYVFVYDMLRKDCGNNFLLDDSLFLGEAITEESYAMYVTLIPYVVRREAVSRIIGEIYEVDEATLHDLDRVEGHPYWYCREQVPVMCRNGRSLNAWVYFCHEGGGELLQSGDYLGWLLSGATGGQAFAPLNAPAVVG